MILQMTPKQHIFAIVLAVALLGFVVELVRQRKLREDYSWFWILASIVVLLLTVWNQALAWVTRLTGAVLPLSALTAMGLVFIVGVCVHLCTKLTELNQQVKRLAQEVAILSAIRPDGTKDD